MSKSEKQYIKPETSIQDISEQFPDIADYLVDEYGFHCTHCFLSEFESLEEGAAVHGIFDEDFQELLDEVNHMARQVIKMKESDN